MLDSVKKLFYRFLKSYRTLILHGVPGATVDVYANGAALLKNFKSGTLTDPQMLPAGSYDLKVVKAGDGPDGDAIVEANDVKVPGGANITVVAHLTAKGKPALTPYVNEVSIISPRGGPDHRPARCGRSCGRCTRWWKACLHRPDQSQGGFG